MLQELNDSISILIQNHPLKFLYSGLAFTTSIYLYLTIYKSKQVLRSSKNQLLKIEDNIKTLNLQTTVKEQKIKQLTSDLQIIEDEINTGRAQLKSYTLSLNEKIDEIKNLRKEDLISAERTAEMIGDLFIKNNKPIDLHVTLTKIKEFQNENFITKLGYEKISSILTKDLVQSKRTMGSKLKQLVS
ncbi:hypothetical protein DSLASN_01790 [Desulfoluna limicola]|uniref:Uncharacterized protein n=1 Tax=Desulfoluna limicola TaxID=2810562 RepID=A0ABM7PAN5_9BACT|nr:hypothetical protein [Desulfoluna limicola]BCS94547.1 hypothetical protein DSLASN_01790 [Desulfoluna limicola]